MVSTNLPDVQNSMDMRGIPIHKVGINNYRIPFRLLDKSNEIQTTIGNVSMYTSLTEQTKGVNMSRYSIVIEKALAHNTMSCEFLDEIMGVLKTELESTDSWVKIKFPYFVKKTAPVSKFLSHFCVNCMLEGKSGHNGEVKKYLTVEVNYMSLCACSKEMSLLTNNLTESETEFLQNPNFPPSLLNKIQNVGFGAHNQRSLCKLTVELNSFIWIEDLIQIIEDCASCPIYNTMKRGDEKFCTEKMYENPRFVEDMAREIYPRMEELVSQGKTENWIAIFEHFEVLHTSNAVSVIKGGKREIN